jgi:hypothetical protein
MLDRFGQTLWQKYRIPVMGSKRLRKADVDKDRHKNNEFIFWIQTR